MKHQNWPLVMNYHFKLSETIWLKSGRNTLQMQRLLDNLLLLQAHELLNVTKHSLCIESLHLIYRSVYVAMYTLYTTSWTTVRST